MRLFHGGGRRLRRTPADAVGKSVVILRDALRESILVEDRELVHGSLPVVARAIPVFGDVAQRQPDQLGGRIVAGEVPARLDDLAQPRVFGWLKTFIQNLARKPWISRTVMPRAYIAMILSSKPVKRRWCLPMSCGSNKPCRSRGTSMASAPVSVRTLLALLPLRWLTPSAAWPGRAHSPNVNFSYGLHSRVSATEFTQCNPILKVTPAQELSPHPSVI